MMALWEIDTPSLRINLKEGAQPVHDRTVLVPHVHKELSFKEIQWLLTLGVLKKDSDFPLASPTCVIPKPKKAMRMVSDFRKVNPKLVRNHFLIPNIISIVQELEGFE